MSKVKQQSTSILELLYLIRAKNMGEMSFADWVAYASQWAKEVIAECEPEQEGTAPAHAPMQSVQECGADEYRSCQ